MILCKIIFKLILHPKIRNMNLRKFTFTILSVALVSFSCKKDDDGVPPPPPRDKQEVYDEDILEIEDYLETHFYNYEAFDDANPYSLANDEFELVFDTISEENGTEDKTPLMDMLGGALSIKTVTEDGIDYKLYILTVREGLGDALHGLDKAVVTYDGTLSTGDSFDSAVTPISFNLTTVGSLGGVVNGFREGLTEFKTSTGYTDNSDGTTVYHSHGIGAVFIPSGLGYFSTPVGSIPSYTPIFFKFGLINRNNTDYDIDGVPSHLEDLNADGSGMDDNTDGDSFVDFIDNDDDGDGILTRYEVEKKEYVKDDGNTPFTTKAAAQSYYDNNVAADEIFIGIDQENDGTFTLHTLRAPNTNSTDSPDLPDYLDPTVANDIIN